MNVELPDTFSVELRQLLEGLLQVQLHQRALAEISQALTKTFFFCFHSSVMLISDLDAEVAVLKNLKTTHSSVESIGTKFISKNIPLH